MVLSVDDAVPLHLADVRFPDWHPLHGGTGAVLAFVLRHPSGLVLFETGIGTGNQFIDDQYQVQQLDIGAAALVEHGHDINEVRLIVNSHLHFDHCGNNARFPGVPIYVQAAEYEVFREPYYTVPEWLTSMAPSTRSSTVTCRSRRAYASCRLLVTHLGTSPSSSTQRTATWCSPDKRSTPRPSTTTSRPPTPLPRTIRRPTPSSTLRPHNGSCSYNRGRVHFSHDTAVWEP